MRISTFLNLFLLVIVVSSFLEAQPTPQEPQGQSLTPNPTSPPQSTTPAIQSVQEPKQTPSPPLGQMDADKGTCAESI
ncbi:hypothetical protein EHQ43_01090 [Leptospira bouyouniensis]|uniref:Uncharacterized protein n=1 Tax=Leptospira bouyouniensis TaxID=2484911 RepID=A0A7I0HX67_9LEPT|nr:hypothetical protein [Leptospira bouyouniensis]TGL09503.1 hypothetical protein EHQ43_01090 [Leptospira bouyouniensis]